MTSNTSSADVPAFIGFVETTVNALRLIHAARQGVIPRITRRLNDSERRTMIKSGAVFVFSVEESGIKRWTDGLLWSPSRIVGNFLVYREISERNSSRGNHKKPYPTEDASTRGIAVHGNSPEHVSFGYKGHSPGGHSSTEQGFKSNGLIKKTITVTIDGSDLHLISYYTAEDIRSGRLKRPSSRSDIMALNMPPHIFRLTNFRNPPKVELGPDGKPRLVCEAEDVDSADCKAEEPTYRISNSPTWSSNHAGQSSPVDGSFPGNSLYPISNPHAGSNTYSRDGVRDRWPVSLDSLRMPPSNRQDIPWPMSPSPTHISPGRRDSSASADSWPSLQTQSGRWQGEIYDTPTGTSGLYLDRSRVRNNPYQTLISVPQGREDAGQLRGYHHHSGQVSGNRDHGSQRLSWLPTAEASGRESRTPHSGSSFESPPPHFSPHGYHISAPQAYGSAWSPSDSISLDLPSVQSPFSAQSTLQSYENSYGAGSGTMSSPEDYSNIEEYES